MVVDTNSSSWQQHLEVTNLSFQIRTGIVVPRLDFVFRMREYDAREQNGGIGRSRDRKR